VREELSGPELVGKVLYLESRVSRMKGMIAPGDFFGTFLSSQKGLLKFLFPNTYDIYNHVFGIIHSLFVSI